MMNVRVRELLATRFGLCLCVAGLLGASGCATKDAIFVTKTSYSVLDVDATPSGISIAHDRVEGYIGPRFNNGQVYPVTGFFTASSNGNVREVKQVFAGGEAASVVLGATPTNVTPVACADDRDRPPLLFATGTTLGIKVGFQEGTILPTSFVLGYRRKEVAWVPVSEMCGPSVLATLDSGATTRAVVGDGKLNAGVTQYFAVGAAAIKLAQDTTIQGIFIREAQNAVGEVAQFNARQSLQNNLTLEILACASRVPDPQFRTVVGDADGLGILPAGSAANILSVDDAKDQFGRYTRQIRLLNGGADPRSAAMTVHKSRVCKLAIAA